VNLLKRRRLLIGGLLVCLAVAYLSYSGLQGSTIYYFTVSEIKQQGDSIHDQNVRVAGEVSPGSVDRESKGLVLSFTVTDGPQSLLVVYEGVVPDAFIAGGDVVVEGKLGADDIFQARRLLVKCPSKYVPES